MPARDLCWVHGGHACSHCRSGDGVGVGRCVVEAGEARVSRLTQGRRLNCVVRQHGARGDRRRAQRGATARRIGPLSPRAAGGTALPVAGGAARCSTCSRGEAEPCAAAPEGDTSPDYRRLRRRGGAPSSFNPRRTSAPRYHGDRHARATGDAPARDPLNAASVLANGRRRYRRPTNQRRRHSRRRLDK